MNNNAHGLKVKLPRRARFYLLAALFFLALPWLLTLYEGHTGKFLVADQSLDGTFFQRTVIYIEHHDAYGAYGTIINKPADESAELPFPDIEGLYIGGPVLQDEELAILYDEPVKGGQHGFDILSLSYLENKMPDLLERLRAGDIEPPVRVYKGLAGWGFLQLDKEIMRGYWHVLDYDAELMFKAPAHEVWEKAANQIPPENL